MFTKKFFILLFGLLLPLFATNIKDTLNREVTIKNNANRVVALGTSLSFITYLGEVDKIIAIESIELKDLDKRAYTYVNKEKVKNLPIVAKGGSTKQLNYEAVIGLKPDVVFVINYNKSQADELSLKLKTPVVVLSYGGKKVDFETIYNSLRITGKILKKEKRANELISYMQNLQKEFKTPKHSKKAYVGAIAYKGLQGLDSTQGDFMPFALAKVENIASKIKKSGHIFMNKEFLFVNNPDTIFIDSACLNIVRAKFQKDKEYFKRLKAFKNNQVYVLLANTYYYINIDQMLANSFFIAKVMYKNEYKNLNPIKKADEIFTMFVDKPMYKILENGLTGFKKIRIIDDKLVLEDMQ